MVSVIRDAPGIGVGPICNGLVAENQHPCRKSVRPGRHERPPQGSHSPKALFLLHLEKAGTAIALLSRKPTRRRRAPARWRQGASRRTKIEAKVSVALSSGMRPPWMTALAHPCASRHLHVHVQWRECKRIAGAILALQSCPCPSRRGAGDPVGKGRV